MGTTDNFDSAAATLAVATSTVPVLLTANGGARNHTLSMLTPFNGRYRYFNATGNLGTLASLGTNTTMSADATYYSDLFIPEHGKVLTGIGVLNGATVGTDKAFVCLFDSAGVLLANSAVTGGGALTAGANIFQQYAFTATYTILKPGRYWLGYQQNGTTATMRTIATATWVDVLASSAAGVNATAPTSITPPTTFTADKAVIGYVY